MRLEKFKEWVWENSLKVGDLVKVTKKIEDAEKCIWISDMNDAVGKVGTVFGLYSETGGVELKFDNRDLNWSYPFESLEKVIDKPVDKIVVNVDEKPIFAIGDHVRVVNKVIPMDWDYNWNDEYMDSMVEGVFCIEDIDGLSVQLDSYLFPMDSVELYDVSEKLAEEAKVVEEHFDKYELVDLVESLPYDAPEAESRTGFTKETQVYLEAQANKIAKLLNKREIRRFHSTYRSLDCIIQINGRVITCIMDTIVNGTVVGIMKCSPEDEFDVKWGIKMAKKKAYMKYCTSIANLYYRKFQVMESRCTDEEGNYYDMLVSKYESYEVKDWI